MAGNKWQISGGRREKMGRGKEQPDDADGLPSLWLSPMPISTA
ncbi:hypothetical protein ACFEA8_002304 [Escherichia coli]